MSDQSLSPSCTYAIGPRENLSNKADAVLILVPDTCPSSRMMMLCKSAAFALTATFPIYFLYRMRPNGLRNGQVFDAVIDFCERANDGVLVDDAVSAPQLLNQYPEFEQGGRDWRAGRNGERKRCE